MRSPPAAVANSGWVTLGLLILATVAVDAVAVELADGQPFPAPAAALLYGLCAGQVSLLGIWLSYPQARALRLAGVAVGITCWGQIIARHAWIDASLPIMLFSLQALLVSLAAERVRLRNLRRAKSEGTPPGRRTFSLASLFIWTAILAISLALVRTAGNAGAHALLLTLLPTAAAALAYEAARYDMPFPQRVAWLMIYVIIFGPPVVYMASVIMSFGGFDVRLGMHAPIGAPTFAIVLLPILVPFTWLEICRLAGGNRT